MHVNSHFNTQRSIAHFKKLALLLFIPVIVAFSQHVQAGRIGPAIALKSTVTLEINKLLFASDNLRLAILGQDEDQIEICLRELMWEVDQARLTSLHVRDFDRRHLLKILDNIKGNLEMSFSSYGEFRKDFFLKVFNQFANIVRIYQVDQRFSIFYCPKDRSTWIQASNKPENPFRSSTVPKDCGLKVNRQN